MNAAFHGTQGFVQRIRNLVVFVPLVIELKRNFKDLWKLLNSPTHLLHLNISLSTIPLIGSIVQEIFIGCIIKNGALLGLSAVVIDKNINEIKDTIHSRVFELKLYKEDQGLNITVNNTPVSVHTGIVTFLSLYEKSMMLQDGESCWVRFNHNVWLELNKNEIINIMNEVGQYRKATDVWEHNLSLQITNATTVNELQQIYTAIMS